MLSSSKRPTNHSTVIRQSMYSSMTKDKSVLSAATRRNIEADSSKKTLRAPVRLVDASGNDYTPLPLLNDDKKLKDFDKETLTDNISQGSFYTQSISSFMGTNPMAFTRSKSQQSSSGYTAESSSTMSDELVEGAGQTMNVITEVKTIKQEILVPVKESELDKPVDILLEETDTMWIFDMSPILFTRDSEECQEIEKKNKEYEILLNSRAGNDKYVERGMNTFGNPQISKTVQTSRIGNNDIGCIVTTWDIYDNYLERAEKEQAEKGGEGNKDENIDINASPNATALEERPKYPDSSTPDFQASRTLQTSRTPTTMDKGQETLSAHSESDLFGTRHSTITASTSNDSQARNEEILNSDKLQYSLFVMERALNMNMYFEKMLYYRDLPYYKELMQELKIAPPEVIVEGDDESDDENIEKDVKGSITEKEVVIIPIRPSFEANQPHLELLWKFFVSFTKGRNVSALAWNRQNPDIVAVSYGDFDYVNQRPGLVCCWSLKNIDFPERTYHLPSGATSISWSKTHSNLLAVGMFDGTISVIDARKKTSEPVVDTKHASGRHWGPVRQLEWVIRISGRSEEHSEVLVSISSDGRVTQWSVRKGFEGSDLMKLKRIATRIPGIGKQRKTDALISQYAAGSSFAFNPSDANIYLAGVEEGHIHKCSCSYNEQYLDNFFGHSAPVYCIKWSPFMDDVFLSCSADWTIKLWHVERQNPVINFQSGVKAVNSLSWSPKSSVIFACVTESAVEVWNLQMSTLDPLIAETICPEYIVLTTVTFTQSGECLIVGDSDGILHTFALRNMPQNPKNQMESLDKTIQSCIASQLNN